MHILSHIHNDLTPCIIERREREAQSRTETYTPKSVLRVEPWRQSTRLGLNTKCLPPEKFLDHGWELGLCCIFILGTFCWVPILALGERSDDHVLPDRTYRRYNPTRKRENKKIMGGGGAALCEM